MRLHFFAIAGIAACLATASATAQSLGSYSILTLRDYVARGEDRVSGSVAVGGDATIVGDTLGVDLGRSKRPLALTVGGNLDYTDGVVRTGSIVYAGKDLSDPERAVKLENGTIRQGEVVDFERFAANMREISTDLAKREQTGGIKFDGSVGYLAAKQDGLNVFNITDKELAELTMLVLDGESKDFRAILNVSGTGIDRLDLATKGLTGSSLLINFIDDDAVMLTGDNLQASILAPMAELSFEGATVGGQVVARSASLRGSSFGGQLFSLAPSGGVAAVPEPTTWGLMILGFGLIGAVMRRRAGWAVRLG